MEPPVPSSIQGTIPDWKSSLSLSRTKPIDRSTDRRRMTLAWESSRTPGVSLALNYVSHFDVFRQHVTRIFTSDTDALSREVGNPGLTHTHTRVCPCVAAIVVRPARATRVRGGNELHLLDSYSRRDDDDERRRTTTTTTMRPLRMYNGPFMPPHSYVCAHAHLRVVRAPRTRALLFV